MENGKLKIILSGGGTGGHIYPSVAVAEALCRELGDGVELLFVGAEGKMEMEKLPALGGVGGLIAVDREGNVALPFNSEGMYRAWGYAGDEPSTGIYRE